MTTWLTRRRVQENREKHPEGYKTWLEIRRERADLLPYKLWVALRERVIAANPICVKCKRNLVDDVDHIIPIAQGGTDDIDNLQGLCRGCHAKKTKKDHNPIKGTCPHGTPTVLPDGTKPVCPDCH